MKKTAGYALLEVVVSIAISAIIITGTAVAFEHAARFNAKAREKLGAEIAVQNAAEIVLAEGYREDLNIDGVTFAATSSEETNYYEVTITSGDVSLTINAGKAAGDAP